MKHVSLPAAAAVIATLMVNVPSAWAVRIKSDRKDCYGESLELRLENQPQFGLSIPFDVLTPTLFLGGDLRNAPEKEQNAWARACHPEPVEVASIYVHNGHRPLRGLGLTDEGPTPRRFKITGGGTINFERLHGQLARNFAAKFGTQITETGLIHHGDLPGGFYVAPDDYRDPQGDVFGFECISGVECSTTYQIKCGAVLTYWFTANLRLIPLQFYKVILEDQWLELDRRMRRAVEPLIVCDPETTDQAGGKP